MQPQQPHEHLPATTSPARLLSYHLREQGSSTSSKAAGEWRAFKHRFKGDAQPVNALSVVQVHAASIHPRRAHVLVQHLECLARQTSCRRSL